DAHHTEQLRALADPAVDMVAFEKERIKGAVRTDFILSAEIIAITLGTVAGATFTEQLLVLAGIAAIMTVGVYGLVAGIVKLDDLGIYLSQQDGACQQSLGRGILRAAPYMMKTLSVLGTAAMFMVGGGILVHGLPVLEHGIHDLIGEGGLVRGLMTAVASGLVGVVAGAIVLGAVQLSGRLFGKTHKE